MKNIESTDEIPTYSIKMEMSNLPGVDNSKVIPSAPYILFSWMGDAKKTDSIWKKIIHFFF